jgi:hypothetical protein
MIDSASLDLFTLAIKAICSDRGPAVNYPFGVTVSPQKPKSEMHAILCFSGRCSRQRRLLNACQ